MNYQENAEKIAKELNVKLTIKSMDYKSFFNYEQTRAVFKCKLLRSKKTYKSVCKEWEAMYKMFNSEELQILSEIE